VPPALDGVTILGTDEGQCSIAGLSWAPTGGTALTLKGVRFYGQNGDAGVIVAQSANANAARLIIRECRSVSGFDGDWNISRIDRVELYDCEGSVALDDVNSALVRSQQGLLILDASNGDPNVNHIGYYIQGGCRAPGNLGVQNIDQLNHARVYCDATVELDTYNATDLEAQSVIDFAGKADSFNVTMTAAIARFSLARANIGALGVAHNDEANNIDIDARGAVIQQLGLSSAAAILNLDIRAGVCPLYSATIGPNVVVDRDASGRITASVGNGANVFGFPAELVEPPFPSTAAVQYSVSLREGVTAINPFPYLTSQTPSGCTVQNDSLEGKDITIQWQRCAD
jgi:hypothetical protein